MSLERFLRGLFAHLPPGFIEVRLIEDKRGGELVDRRFFTSIDDMRTDLDRLLRLGEARNAAVFFGVLPRGEAGKGAAADTADGLVVWADLDFKDYPGGEVEARARLAAFPIQPSIIVRSGHGLHAYWLTREPTAPQELSRLSKGIARAVGGDHAFDAARILRLPGTYNRKDPAHPLLVEIEVFEEERAYNPSEIGNALDLLGIDLEATAAPTASPAPEQGVEIRISSQLSTRVLRLLETKQRLKAVYEGRGKPALGFDGRPLDRSRSGYDHSFAHELFHLGVHDLDEVATAVALRPDAAQKDHAYVLRTVRSAWERYQAVHGGEDDDPADEIDFVVERVQVTTSVPAIFVLTIEGKQLRFTSAEIRTAASFETRFLDVLKRWPALPSKKGYRKLVARWLESAELLELPPEASEEHALGVAIEREIAALPEGSDKQALERGAAVGLSGKRLLFTVEALFRRMHEDWPALKRPELCRLLRARGYVPGSERLGEDVAWGWRKPAADFSLETRA